MGGIGGKIINKHSSSLGSSRATDREIIGPSLSEPHRSMK